MRNRRLGCKGRKMGDRKGEKGVGLWKGRERESVGKLRNRIGEDRRGGGVGKQRRKVFKYHAQYIIQTLA